MFAVKGHATALHRQTHSLYQRDGVIETATTAFTAPILEREYFERGRMMVAPRFCIREPTLQRVPQWSGLPLRTPTSRWSEPLPPATRNRLPTNLNAPRPDSRQLKI